VHYPGCKRAHTHGAAGSFVGSGRRRNPTRGPNYDAIRNKLWKAEATYENLNSRYQYERAKPAPPAGTVTHQRKLISYRMRLQTLADTIKALSMRLFPDG